MISRRALLASGGAALAAGSAGTCARAQQGFPGSGVSSRSPAPDLFMDIAGSRREFGWPAYDIREGGRTVGVPFSPLLVPAPAGYAGDFHVDEFTDERIRQRWLAAERCASKTRSDALTYAVMFGERNEFRATGRLQPAGSPRCGVGAALADVRRPAFFARAPYAEVIATLDDRTTVIEVVVDADANHRLLTGETAATLRLRGWHIRGEGVLVGRRRQRALAIMLGGRGTELTAIQDPADIPFAMKTEARICVAQTYPSRTSEKGGAREYRERLVAMHAAGFDVLAMDYRGHGLSDGVNASNAYQQAMDVFRVLEAMETGTRLTVIGPDGRQRAGANAAGTVLDGIPSRRMPIVLTGESQGSMIASYAMHANFVSRRAFDTLPGAQDDASLFDYDIRGAAVLAEYAKGLGYGYQVSWDGISTRAPDMSEAALRARYAIAFCPSSEILRGISAWPALFVGRGLWDSAGALEGSLEAYRRARGLKEIAVFRGPHGSVEAGPRNSAILRERVVAFAVRAILGERGQNLPDDATLKDLVLSAPPYWGEFMQPPPTGP